MMVSLSLELKDDASLTEVKLSVISETSWPTGRLPTSRQSQATYCYCKFTILISSTLQYAVLLETDRMPLTLQVM